MSGPNALRREPLKLAYSDPRERGEPILFVHGFSHNRVVWEDVIRALPDRWRPVCVDLRGHGESPWSPEGHYGLDDYAADLSGLLDSLDIREAHIVGHSLGGNVTTLFAASHPRRVRSLTLVDTGPSLAATASAHIAEEVGEALRSYASVDEYRAQLSMIHPLGAGSLLDRLAGASVVRRIDARFELALDPGVLGEGVDPADVSEIEHELWTALGSLGCPTFVIRGGLSSILSEKVAMEMVNEVLSFGRLTTLPRAGHAIMIDDADGLRHALLEFLEASYGD